MSKNIDWTGIVLSLHDKKTRAGRPTEYSKEQKLRILVLQEKQSELEKELAKSINKAGSEENLNWCVETAAKKYGAAEGSIWIDGIVEFKGKQMCHIRYFSVVVNGTMQYDWYFTENEEEIYRVTTSSSGEVEETKVV